MAKEILPEHTSRAAAFALWMHAPNPMVTFFKTLDVTNLIRVSKRKHWKCNMLIAYCIGKAAASIREFYVLPVGNRLMQYDTLAVDILVKSKDDALISCDIPVWEDLEVFCQEYLQLTSRAALHGVGRDLSADSMVIGTSAILDTELDGIIGMNSGVFHNPFLMWGRYRKKLFRYRLPVSFQFHHTQMDGAQAGQFLENLQREMDALR